MYHKGQMDLLVEQVGMSHKKYECVFMLVDANSLSHIRVPLPIRDTEGIFLGKNSFWKLLQNAFEFDAKFYY